MGDMKATRENKRMKSLNRIQNGGLGFGFYEGVARIVMARQGITTFDELVEALKHETEWTRICRVMVAEKVFGISENSDPSAPIVERGKQ